MHAAAVIADEGGIEGLSLASVAEKLGVRPPSLYHHVDGLESLRRTLAIHGANELRETFAVAAKGLRGKKALLAVARAYRAFAKKHPGQLASMLPAPRQTDDEELYKALAAPVAEIMRILTDVGIDGDDAVHVVRALRKLSPRLHRPRAPRRIRHAAEARNELRDRPRAFHRGDRRAMTRARRAIAALSLAWASWPACAFAEAARPMALGSTWTFFRRSSAPSMARSVSPRKFGSVSNPSRIRFVGAHLEPPDALAFADSGFRHPTTTAFAAIVDYTTGAHFDGFWVGSGFEIWQQSIEHDGITGAARWTSTVFTVGGGYIWRVSGNFFLDPWLAVHATLNPQTVNVGVFEYKPSGRSSPTRRSESAGSPTSESGLEVDVVGKLVDVGRGVVRKVRAKLFGHHVDAAHEPLREIAGAKTRRHLGRHLLPEGLPHPVVNAAVAEVRDPHAAFDVYASALGADNGNEETLSSLERLGSLSGRWQEVVTLYDEELEKLDEADRTVGWGSGPRESTKCSWKT